MFIVPSRVIVLLSLLFLFFFSIFEVTEKDLRVVQDMSEDSGEVCCRNDR